MEPLVISKLIIAALKDKKTRSILVTIVLVVVSIFVAIIFIVFGIFWMLGAQGADRDVYNQAASRFDCFISPGILDDVRIIDAQYYSFYDIDKPAADDVYMRMKNIYLYEMRITTTTTVPDPKNPSQSTTTTSTKGQPVCKLNKVSEINASPQFKLLDAETREAIVEIMKNNREMYDTVTPIAKGYYSFNHPFGIYADLTGSHYGVDLGASYGTPVLSAHDGTVIRAIDYVKDNVKSPDTGNMVVIKCKVDLLDGSSRNIYFYYMHMAEGSVKVKVGQTVKAGEQIGKVGNTGASFGAHLHFQLCYSAYICHKYTSPGIDPEDFVKLR